MTLFDIAAHFRVLDVSQILKKLNRRQRAYWIAYFDLKPPGADRLDIILPKLFADLMNSQRMSNEAPVVTFNELHIDWQADPPEQVDYTESLKQSQADMVNQILAVF
jgi:hypothetical protein